MYQYIVDKEERDIEYVDFRGMSMEEAEELMKLLIWYKERKKEWWNKNPFVPVPYNHRKGYNIH